MVRVLKTYGYKYYKDINYNEYYKSSLFINDDNLIIVDHNLKKDKEHLFSYGLYCDIQNSLMLDFNKVFRFNYNNLDKFKSEFLMIINSETIDITKYSSSNRNEYYGDNSVAEKKFEDLFIETFGNDSLDYLHKEEPVTGINGDNYFIDFTLETTNGNYAFEANGINYHHPLIIGLDSYDRQLLKQNTLMLLGYKTLRFSTENLNFKDRTIDVLKMISDKDKFINKALLKGKREFKLYNHQEDTLRKFDEDRKNNINTQLVVLPTGSGKSQIILEDLNKDYIKGNVKNVLILTPSLQIKLEWLDRVKNINNYNIDVLTYNKAYRDMHNNSNDYYDYIAFDEAHHAMSNNNKKLLAYYTPKYLIGMTATDIRLDMQKLENIFGEYDVNLTIKEAIEKDIISNIRCFRLHSNINLKDVRFNDKDYNYADLEKTLIVDSRNYLISV